MRLKIILILMVFVFASSVFASSVFAENAFNYYIQGEDYLMELTQEDNMKAITAFENAIELDPEMSHAYAGLAKAYAQKYQYFDKSDEWYVLAIEMAEKARIVDPFTYDVPEADIALARAYDAKGEYEKAEKEYAKLVELYPEYSEIYPDVKSVADEEREIGESGNDVLMIVVLVIIGLVIGLATVTFFVFKHKKGILK